MFHAMVLGSKSENVKVRFDSSSFAVIADVWNVVL